MKIGIAGAGLLGRLLAWRLSQHHEVTLFEAGPQNGAASSALAAAGMLCPIAELENSLPWLYDLSLHSLASWQHWAKDALSGLDLNLQGSWVLAHPSDAADLQLFYQRVCAKQPELQSLIKRVSAADFAQQNPGFKAPSAAILALPNEGCLRPKNVFAVLDKQLANNKIHWHAQTTVEQVLPGEIITDDAQYAFDYVCDCRGLGAQSTFPDLRAVRGELVWLHAPEVQLSRVLRLMHPRYRLYIVPQGNHQYIIGASEIESASQQAITVRTLLELLTAAYSLHSGFAEATVIKTVTHARPTLSDNMPQLLIDDNKLALNGLYRHGYLIAPYMVNLAAKWVNQEALPDNTLTQALVKQTQTCE